MCKIVFVALIIGMSLVFGGCNRIPSLEPIEQAGPLGGEQVAPDRSSPKMVFGIPVPEGMDMQTFLQIFSQAQLNIMDQLVAPIQAQIDAWRAQGLSREEINRKLNEEGHKKERMRRRLELLQSELAKLFSEWERRHEQKP